MATLIGPLFLWAGNPDRQGEAGAYELLLNPWARSSGLNSLGVANVTGLEAIFLNPAGLSFINKLQVAVAHTRYLSTTGISINQGGFAAKMGKNGTIGFNLMLLDFGSIPLTTSSQPEGLNVSFKPSFMNIGLSYAHRFDKISTALTARFVSESVANASASGFCFDAGVQYVTGPNDNVRFGLSLKNIGTEMSFGGDGLSFLARPSNTPTSNPGAISIDRRANGYNLPSQLNIGGSYDFLLGESREHRLTAVAAFIANSFDYDNIGAGVEYAFKNMFMLRSGYRYRMGGSSETSVNNGLSAGASIQVPLSNDKKQNISVDYSYRHTERFNGTHTFGMSLNF